MWSLWESLVPVGFWGRFWDSVVLLWLSPCDTFFGLCSATRSPWRQFWEFWDSSALCLVLLLGVRSTQSHFVAMTSSACCCTSTTAWRLACHVSSHHGLLNSVPPHSHSHLDTSILTYYYLLCPPMYKVHAVDRIRIYISYILRIDVEKHMIHYLYGKNLRRT